MFCERLCERRQQKVATLKSILQTRHFSFKLLVALTFACVSADQMSCFSNSARKRKLQNSECEKPPKKKMAWDSFNSIKDFGYMFNEEGRLVDDSGAGFNFQVSDDHSYNQENYEALGEVITEYVYELLQNEKVGLKKLDIPKAKESSILFVKQKSKDAAKGFIFVSEDFDKKEKLLVLVHGSGVVRAGQWARRLIINDCLDHGTQIPYIKQAIKDGYGIVVTNTNQNEALVEVKEKKMWKAIKESESPERHFSYVWKNIIEKSAASKIFVVAHSYGGYLVVNYFSRNPKILERVVAVAFTDSVHSLSSHSRGRERKWFLENSVNWVTSNEDLDTPMTHQDADNYTTRLSAGTTKHEETSWKSMDSIFKYFQNKELDFNKPDNEKNKRSGKSEANNESLLNDGIVDCRSLKVDKKCKKSNSERHGENEEETHEERTAKHSSQAPCDSNDDTNENQTKPKEVKNTNEEEESPDNSFSKEKQANKPNEITNDKGINDNSSIPIATATNKSETAKSAGEANKNMNNEKKSSHSSEERADTANKNANDKGVDDNSSTPIATAASESETAKSAGEVNKNMNNEKQSSHSSEEQEDAANENANVKGIDNNSSTPTVTAASENETAKSAGEANKNMNNEKQSSAKKSADKSDGNEEGFQETVV